MEDQDDGWAGRDLVHRPIRTTCQTMPWVGRARPHGVGEALIRRQRGWHRELQQERTASGAVAQDAEAAVAVWDAGRRPLPSRVVFFSGCRGGLVESCMGPTCHERWKTDELLTE
jgi:hypothetical protein